MISKKDRTRIIWASFVLITFLILLFVGIVVLGLDFTGAVGTQIIFMSNVAVAISAAVIASSLTGFLDVVVERKFGNSGKVAIRAAGGFAVFAIIMWMSPSNTMKSIEESLFAQASQKCSSAVEGNSGADGLEWCEQLVDRYPTDQSRIDYLLGIGINALLQKMISKRREMGSPRHWRC